MYCMCLEFRGEMSMVAAVNLMKNVKRAEIIWQGYFDVSVMKIGFYMKIKYIHEPNDLQCGQAVLAMLTGVDINRIIEDLIG